MSSIILNESDPRSRKASTLSSLENHYRKRIVYCQNDFQCPICLELVGMQNNKKRGIRIMSCLHEVCQDCIIYYAKISQNPEIMCPFPECTLTISEAELKAICPSKTIERLHHISLSRARCSPGETLAVCYTPNCPGMAILEVKPEKGVVFLCSICQKVNCVACNVQHPGQSCNEYEYSLKQSENDKNSWQKSKKLTQKRIQQGLAMHCPKCNVLIEKISGCDGVICSLCNLDICWATKGPRWGPRGRGDTTGGCRCSFERRCHPSCGNCH